MITIQNGKLCIPDNDRFVGFAGDDSVTSKQLVMLNRAPDGCTFKLCLRFDNDAVYSVPLTAAADGDDTVLTWTVQKEQLCASGIVTAQLKTVGSDGSISHTTKDFFIVGAAVESDEDGEEREYVTSAELRNSINQALEAVCATSPYVGKDGYWYIYNPETGGYVQTEYQINGTAPDSAMSDSSANIVENRVIKQYIDTKTAECSSFARTYADLKSADKADNRVTVAGLPLTADITAANLANAILSNLYRTGVIPNITAGTKGQSGIGKNGEIFYCTATDRWERLATYADVDDKMDLIEEVDAADVGFVSDGNMYLSDGDVFIRYDDAGIELAKASDVYTKSEIDAMIGSITSLLAAI